MRKPSGGCLDLYLEAQATSRILTSVQKPLLAHLKAGKRSRPSEPRQGHMPSPARVVFPEEKRRHCCGCGAVLFGKVAKEKLKASNRREEGGLKGPGRAAPHAAGEALAVDIIRAGRAPLHVDTLLCRRRSRGTGLASTAEGRKFLGGCKAPQAIGPCTGRELHLLPVTLVDVVHWVSFVPEGAGNLRDGLGAITLRFLHVPEWGLSQAADGVQESIGIRDTGAATVLLPF